MSDLEPYLEHLPELLRDGVRSHWEHYLEIASEEGITPPQHPETLATLCRVWAGSDFVANTTIHDPAMFAKLMAGGDLYLQYSGNDYLLALQKRLRGVKDEDELARRLRHFRQREMCRIAWRDLAGWADLQETLRDLSALAEACVDGALYYLQLWAMQESGEPCDAEGKRQSLVVLGMGKLGAGELNFSSDVDLIFAFPEEGETRGKRSCISNEEFFSRLAKRLICIINDQTEDGFVFRVDVRLRPFGDSGPVVSSFDSMEDYYQTHGREWERYALIKADVIAGDRIAGAELLEVLRPFIYRRYLDFGAFESLREMKQLIHQQIKRKGMKDNIKLGPGGIREVEFIGQAFQLIRGGKERNLQLRGIQAVLTELQNIQALPVYVVTELQQAYEFLRNAENRLQAMADQQTHSLPTDEVLRARLAFAMGYDDWRTFEDRLALHMHKVHSHFEQVFSAPQTEHAASDELDLTSVWQEVRDGSEVLQQLGYHNGDDALEYLHNLRHSHSYRALTSQGVQRMDRLVPLVLGAAARTESPEDTLQRVLQILETVARRSVYLVLLVENPVALSQLVRLCAASQWISELIAEHPLLLDELLDPRNLYLPLARSELQHDLQRRLQGVPEDDLEQQMEILRHFKQINVLRVAAADITASLPLMKVSDYLSDIAEVILEQILKVAWQHLLQRHGQPPGTRREIDNCGLAIIAYGKLGGLELGYGSDLDLVFVYHGKEGTSTSGKQPLPIEVFYARLGQRMIHMLNTLTPSGVLYEVDMRLRPSGASGLLVTHIDSLTEYQQEKAWTWEHQALVRARAVVGDTALMAQFRQLRRQILTRPRPAEALREDILTMRQRMREEHASRDASQFQLKHDPGGITDIEFMVQYMVLRWADSFPQLTDWTDDIRLLETLVACGQLSQQDAALLADAYRDYRAVVHRKTLQDQSAVVAAGEFQEYRQAVIRIWNSLLEEQ